MTNDQQAIRDAVASWHRATAAADLAYCWTKLTVRVIPIAGGDAKVRSGNALSIFRKQSDGSWVLIRDANMLSPA